jgi:hypothetical protein
MPSHTSPEIVVQRQLDAYNSKNLNAWLSTYASDAQQFELGGKNLASGIDEIRARAELRFSEPDLHAALVRRVVFGNIVVDHEDVTRTFEHGIGKVELVCIYVVEEGLIQSATFGIGPSIMVPQA